MKKTHAFAGLVLSMALFGAGLTNAFAADETLRSLADKNGIYIGAILNSQWFGGGLPGNYEQIHKQQFNIVVAENEMKFDATEPQEGRFNYNNGGLAQPSSGLGKQLQERQKEIARRSQEPHRKGCQPLERSGRRMGRGERSHQQQRTPMAHRFRVVPGYRSGIHRFRLRMGNDYNLEQGVNPKAKAGFLLEQVKRWVANGIPIHCVGSQTHVEDTTTDKHFIGSPDSLRSLAKELAKLNVKLKITELDIGFKSGINVSKSDLERQGQTFRQYLDIILEEPNADTYLIWGVSDKWSWLGGLNRQKGLIYDDNLKPKPAFDSILVRLQTYEPPKDSAKADSTVKDSTAKDSTAKDSTALDPGQSIKQFNAPNSLSLHVAGRTLFVTGLASKTAVKVDLLDLQGRPVYSTNCINGTVDLSNIAEGLYVVRVQNGSTNLTKRISIK